MSEIIINTGPFLFVSYFIFKSFYKNFHKFLLTALYYKSFSG